MSKYSDWNVRQKLARARLLFLNSKISKSGKNLSLEFKYFELQDIVPTAIRIFDRLGLVTETGIDQEGCYMNVINADNMDDESMRFFMPYRENDAIVSKTGKVVTNNLQLVGMSVTYIRRYLWMMVLDITEPDEVDPNLGVEEEPEEEQVLPKPKKERKPKTPATPEERKEAKKELIAADGQANEKQIADLKSLCKKLIALDDKQEDFVHKIALKTDSFTNISESACKALSVNLEEMIGAYGTAE